jgi:hypothetical protein
MQMLIVDKKALKNLIHLNKSSPFRKIVPSLLKDGRRVLNIDILTDTHHAGGYKRQKHILDKCFVEEIDAATKLEMNPDIVYANSVELDERLIRDDDPDLEKSPENKGGVESILTDQTDTNLNGF